MTGAREGRRVLELVEYSAGVATFEAPELPPTLSGPEDARVSLHLSLAEWVRLGRPERLTVSVRWEA